VVMPKTREQINKIQIKENSAVAKWGIHVLLYAKKNKIIKN
jgi:hypothetical protein